MVRTTILRGAALLAIAAPAAAQQAQPAPAPAPNPTTVQPAQPSQPAPVAAGAAIPAPLLERIDAGFRRFQEERHVPGLVWGIVRDGRLVHLGTSGVQELEARRPVTGESLFRIASMSKAFTALAILKLRDEGRLSLDALAEEYVPEMRGWRYPTADSPRIRVRDLLSHTGGFVTDNPWGDRQQVLPEAEFTRMLAEGVPFTRAPGTAFEYSNFGYALLGRIITNVSGRPYDQYIRDEIMRPLGMMSTGYEVAESPAERRAIGYRWHDGTWTRDPDMAHGAFGAMGGVETSAADYARWTAFLLSAWPPSDGVEAGPVRRSSVRELAQGLNFPSLGQRPGETGEEACRQAGAYGMGFRVVADCDVGTALSHSGGYPGYGSYLLLLPEQGVGLFAFASRTYAAPVPAVWDAALALHEAGQLPRRTIPVTESLAVGYRAAGAMYRAGNVGPAGELLAMNFLMDRSAEDWARDFAGMKLILGECRTDAPITATGALSGRFAWTCERGRLDGELLLAPTDPAGIQELNLRAAPVE
ncbi:serine hydrolase domain-containing protein [Sphingosinicella terrae]|uniref:serine hydrolase domain-containing protein n=1 Tax=Sphingosinicella terrae TaxID=2172047 RepID=UPI000E0D2F49|nr:serine hydrolase domain-containing protein [Sphingosinicella terrae]